VREWLEAQKDRSVIPGEDDAAGDLPARQAHFHLVCYPFEGRLAHTTLAMLLTRRLDRMGVGAAGLRLQRLRDGNIWSLKPMDGLDLDELFAQDMLGDDLEAWLAESFMMKRAFKGCAIIAG
jgi:ATP-dependent Lhr-like helicase